MKPQFEVYSKSDLSTKQKADLAEWFDTEFGHIPYQWADPDWYVLASMASGWICRLGIVERTVFVDGQSIAVAGISGVITHSAWRGRKIASTVLKKAADHINDELDVEFALLLCRQEMAPVYAKLGWMSVDGPTVFWQPTGKLTYPKLTMILECGRKSWPPGPIDLCGLPW
jgi:hypothetical protein